MVFDSSSSNIDELLSINSSANFFVFGDFKVHHKDWLTYSTISNDLTQMIYLYYTILDLFIPSNANICSTMAFPQLENSDHVVVSVSIDFPSNSQRNVPFHHIAYGYSLAGWDGLQDNFGVVLLEDIFKLSASAAAGQFREHVQVGIDIYIPHRKYQVKPHSSLWFSAACAAAIVRRNHFLRLYQKDKSQESSDRLVIFAKGFLKLPSLPMLIKQKSPLLPRNLDLGTIDELLIVFSTKVNLLYIIYSTVQRFCLLGLIKQICLLENFLRTLILNPDFCFLFQN